MTAHFRILMPPFSPALRVVSCRHPTEAPTMPKFLCHMAFVLFTVLGIPVLIALPFLLSGFIGRR